MSWIFGVINKNRKESLNANFPEDAVSFQYNANGIHICGGGFKGNLINELVSEGTHKNYWIVAGTAFNALQQPMKILDKKEWSVLLSAKNKNDIIKSLDGHFVIIQWDNEVINFYTDTLGLRDIYFYNSRDQIFFTTKPILLSKFIDLEIDYSVFGSKWYLFNQISKASIFKNITRLSSGDRVKIHINNSFNVEFFNYEWIPYSDTHELSVKDFGAKLKKLTKFPLKIIKACL